MSDVPKCLKIFQSILKNDSRLILDLPQGFKRAAVLIPIFRRNNQWMLIFTRRTDRVKHHKGEIAFPGGKFEPEIDEDLIHTALRETTEELGISKIEIIGVLDDITTISKYIVTPVIGFIPHKDTKFHYTKNHIEIDYILEVSISRLAKPEIFSLREFRYKNNLIIRVPFFNYNGEVIWGATGRILINLLIKLNGLSPICRFQFMNQDFWEEPSS